MTASVGRMGLYLLLTRRHWGQYISRSAQLSTQKGSQHRKGSVKSRMTQHIHCFHLFFLKMGGSYDPQYWHRGTIGLLITTIGAAGLPKSYAKKACSAPPSAASSGAGAAAVGSQWRTPRSPAAGSSTPCSRPRTGVLP